METENPFWMFIENILRDEDEDNAADLTMQDFALLSIACSLNSIAQDLNSIRRLGIGQKLSTDPHGWTPPTAFNIGDL